MMRTRINILLLILLLPSFWVELYAQSSARPNIIFILADDLGWSSLSCRMQKDDERSASDYHETPHLARLAAEGMRFSRGYASAAICSPSRRSILFGSTPARLGDESFADAYDPRTNDHATIPMALKALDGRYKTAHYGKWDMRAGFFPEDAGYDESDGDTGNGHGNIFAEHDDKWTKHFMQNDPKRAFTLTARASNFIERQVRSGNPFYLQISHYATHVDIQARPQTYQKYKKKTAGRIHHEPGFAAMLDDLDATIGEVMETVNRLGIADNTYIFFMADNGATEFLPPVRNRLDHPDVFDYPMRNYPLRGGKWTLYEGGIRVPFIVKGPGVAANSQCDVPVTGSDLLPTFVALAQSSRSKPSGIDGGSFAPLLHGGGRGRIVRTNDYLIFHRFHEGYPHSALIDGDLKVIKFWKTGKVELYDLRKDPGERNDLSAEDPARANKLVTRLVAYLNDVNPKIIAQYK